VRERAAALGLSDDEYAERVGASPTELARLIELLRVGETRFFRHRKQLEALATRVLPSLHAPVTAWSAGCASGEEAWTLAMLMTERGLLFSLLATDLSTPALAVAQKGRYPAARVDGDVPSALVRRYFRRIGDDCVLNDRLRPHVRFRVHNLLVGTPPRDVDLLLCRNVLIYFDEARRAEAVSRLVKALKPGGYLLVGYSETLRNHPELSGEAHGIYRRASSPAPFPAPPPGTSRSVPGSTSISRSTPTLERRLALKGEYPDGRRLAGELRGVVGDGRVVLDLDGATFLGDEAARVLRRAIEAAPAMEVRATRTPVRRWLVRHGIKAR
jgi:chemotaxis protein methyltransferase CheR